MPNLSAVPAAPITLDLGDGEREYRLRWTNYAEALFRESFRSCFEGREELHRRFVAARDKGDERAAARIYSELPPSQQLRSVAYSIWAMLQFEHPDVQLRDVLHALPYNDPEALAPIVEAVRKARDDGSPEPKDEGENPTKPTTARPGKRKPKAARSSSSKSGSRSKNTSS